MLASFLSTCGCTSTGSRTGYVQFVCMSPNLILLHKDLNKNSEDFSFSQLGLQQKTYSVYKHYLMKSFSIRNSFRKLQIHMNCTYRPQHSWKGRYITKITMKWERAKMIINLFRFHQLLLLISYLTKMFTIFSFVQNISS